MKHISKWLVVGIVIVLMGLQAPFTSAEVLSPSIGIEVPTAVILEHLPPILVRICTAESGFHQFNPDGTVLRGKINHHDIGICQINSIYHLAEAKELNLDIFTLRGNILFALWLFNKEGTTPWNWSKPIWNVQTKGA